MGMLERGSEGKPSRVRVQMVEKVRRPHLTEIIHANVEKKSFVMTDALRSYTSLGEEGFIHMAVNHAVRYAEGRNHTNGLENFWSLMKRTLLGTYVACEPFDLEAYLDEQTFRFNNRKDTDADRFVRVLKSFSGKRLTYAQLIGETGVVPSSAGVDGDVASVVH
ncbi:MAG TPA: IS1595 family transposase [Phycisphaerae bacterium]|nr:IS1595 family transposase [Phycisphaerae bacterium]